jgi:hypothetical protein
MARLSLTLPDDLVASIDQAAAQQGTTRTYVIEQALRDFDWEAYASATYGAEPLRLLRRIIQDSIRLSEAYQAAPPR